jgi:hypothetical protein
MAHFKVMLSYSSKGLKETIIASERTTNYLTENRSQDPVNRK